MEAIKWSEETLNSMLTEPSAALVEDLKRLEGDIMVLGAGGKMGPDICVLAKKASVLGGSDRKIYAVSRFSDAAAAERLRSHGVTVIAADLMDANALQALPDCKNIIYMAGRKFGTNGTEYLTWGMNAWLPCMVAQRFRQSNIVVFSSGNLYPKVSTASGGATERVRTVPVGEYCMSCLGRERAFEYAARTMGTRIAIMRLNYAVDLRYGVLHDIAQTILAGAPVDLSAMPSFNCIWQKDANEAAIRLLLHTSAEVEIMNVTGPETAGVRETAAQLAALLGKPVTFVGEEAPTAYLSCAGKMFGRMGYPTVPLQMLIEWQAQWLLAGGRSLGKPTHFEERNGNY